MTPSEPAVRCRALTRRFPDTLAVDRLDLDVALGECLAILGPNGAGKTTTVEMIEGLTPPTSGELTLFGASWGQGRASDAQLRASIGVQLQESHFHERLTVAETLALCASFYPSARPVDELIALVSLESKAASFVGKLSGGQRQRLALACALAGRPRLLCLDEPTTGLDPQSRRQIWDIAAHFKAEGGTVLLTTHYMEEAAHLADRVAIMDHGRLVALDTPDGLITSLGADEVITLDLDRPLPPAALEALPGVGRVTLSDDAAGQHLRLTVSNSVATLTALLALVTAEDLHVSHLTTHRATLEDVFIHHTGRGLRDA